MATAPHRERARLSDVSGRFAPSPTGDLHLGNLRTALAAWLMARVEDRGFLVRMEDLDRTVAASEHERSQLADLAMLGLDHDGDVVRQSERFDLHRDALADLRTAGLVYECWCTRREIAAEIAAAASAPHGSGAGARPGAGTNVASGGEVMVPDGAYPGTCRELTARDRARRAETGRPPALRLRAGGEVVEVHDRLCGVRRGVVDDLVLQRGDGVPAYNLAVVVDDHLQGVTQVVRGDDLLPSTPRQVHLHHLLGLDVPEYAHVPLVLGDDGERLAKRHGAVTLRDLRDEGLAHAAVLSALARSLGCDVAGDLDHAARLLDADPPFDPTAIPRHPLTLPHVLSGDPEVLNGGSGVVR